MLSAACVSAALAQGPGQAPPFVAPSLPPAEFGDETPVERSVLNREPADGAPTPGAVPMAAPIAAIELTQGVTNERDTLLATLRSSHPWARYEPGAWRRLKIVSEVFDETGAFAGRSVSERTERLVAVEDQSYTLSIEPVVEIAGRRTPGPVEAQKRWLLNDRPTEQPLFALAAGEPTSISLGELVVPCRTWTIDSGVFEAGSPTREEKLTLYVSLESEPAVLRRQRQAILEGKPGPLVTESVTRFGTPVVYGEELTSAWHVATTTEHPTGERTEKFAIRGADAPGGLYQESATEYDLAGAKTRWQVTRLVASGRTPSEDIGSPKPKNGPPSISVEVRPRRLLQLFRRGEEAEKERPDPGL